MSASDYRGQPTEWVAYAGAAKSAIGALLKTLLLIERDNSGGARLLGEMLKQQLHCDLAITHVSCVGEAEIYLARHFADMVLLDVDSHPQALACVQRVRATAPACALVVLLGIENEPLGADILKGGAQEYLIKGQITPYTLASALYHATEHKNIETTLFLQNESARSTLHSIGDGVICADSQGQICFLNAVAMEMTGWSAEEAAGRTLEEVLQIVDATTRLAIPNPMAVAISENRNAHLPPDSILLRRDGTEITIEDTVSPLRDRKGNAGGAVMVIRDVSAARVASRQIAHLAQHDFLTGLPNRMLLNDRVGQAIATAQRHNKVFAVLFLDLDGFKPINDSLGHQVGDKLLQSIAKRLVGCVRDADTVSRQGGDEFIMLLSEVERPEDAAITAARVLEAVADVHSIDDTDLHVTASIGISIYPHDGLSVEALTRNADIAMYHAKKDGRQTYKFFKPVSGTRAIDGAQMPDEQRNYG